MLAGPVNRLSRTSLDRVVAATAISLSVAAALAVGLSAPWPLRFGVVTAALLFGPAVPVFRLVSDMRLSECLAVGVAVNVALVMLLGEAMVLAHVWAPVLGAIALLCVTVAISVRLVVRSVRVTLPAECERSSS